MGESLDSFLRQNQQAGQLDSHGVFTINLDRARDQLARLSLASPADYLLKLIQGAVQMRSQAMEISIKPKRTNLSFRCPDHQVPPLEDLLRQIREPERAEPGPTRDLSFGLGALMCQDPARIVLTLATPKRTHRLTITPGGAECSEHRGMMVSGVSLEVERNLGLWQNRKRAAAERNTIQSRADLAPLSLAVNGRFLECALFKWYSEERPFLLQRRLTDERRLPPVKQSHYRSLDEQLWIARKGWTGKLEVPALLVEQLDSKSLRGVLELLKSQPGILVAVINGVTTPTLHIPVPILAAVFDPDLNTDLSGLNLVRDEKYDTLLETLRRQRQSMKNVFIAHLGKVEKLLPRRQRSAFRESAFRQLKDGHADYLEGDIFGRWCLLERLQARERLYRACHTDTGAPGLFWIIRGKRYQAMLNRWAELDLGYGSPIFLAGEMPDQEGYLATEARSTLSLESLDDPIPVLLKVGEILARAHDQGLAHGEVHPDSVLLDLEGQPFLRPPVRFQDVHTTMTTGGQFDWVAYLAPEQLMSGQDHLTSDQYLLAVLAHWLLTGRDLFGGKEDPIQVVFAHLQEEPSPPEEMDPKLWAVLARALRKDPAERYSGMREMLADLALASGHG